MVTKMQLQDWSCAKTLFQNVRNVKTTVEILKLYRNDQFQSNTKKICWNVINEVKGVCAVSIVSAAIKHILKKKLRTYMNDDHVGNHDWKWRGSFKVWAIK